MFNFFKKGLFYYECQILMIVIMWRHNDTLSTLGGVLRPTHGFVCGRLYIWYDPTWKIKLKADAKYLCYTIETFFERVGLIIISYYAFTLLTVHGFLITYYYSSKNDLEIYRFNWKDKVLQNFPDIDAILEDEYVIPALNNKKYSTLFNGKVTRLN